MKRTFEGFFVDGIQDFFEPKIIVHPLLAMASID